MKQTRIKNYDKLWYNDTPVKYSDYVSNKYNDIHKQLYNDAVNKLLNDIYIDYGCENLDAFLGKIKIIEIKNNEYWKPSSVIIKFTSNDGQAIPLLKLIIRGKQSNVIGKHSVGLGRYNTVTGETSMAVNYNNTVEAKNAFAAGSDNTIKAAAEGAFVSGCHNEAKSIYQTIIGTYSEVEENDSFVIGNGSSDVDRGNAFKVKKNGDVEVSGTQIALGQTTLNEAELIELKSIKTYIDSAIEAAIETAHQWGSF